MRLTGTPASDAATFAFSQPVFNSPLFSPLYSASRTTAIVNATSADCEVPIESPASAAAALNAAFLESGELQTSLEDPLLANHLVAVEEAGSNTTLWVDGSFLLSQGVSALLETNDVLLNTFVVVDGETTIILADIVRISQQAASVPRAANPVVAQLVGGRSAGQDFCYNLETLLSMSMSEPMFTRRMIATFGRYGGLPVIEVAIPIRDVYVLVDAVSGRVSPPYQMGTPFDATELLTQHPEFDNESAHRLVSSSTGCPVLSDTKTPETPPTGPGALLPTPGPALPPGWTPLPGTPTGKPSKWTCKGGITTPTECSTDYNYVRPCGGSPPNVVTVPGGCLHKITITCTSTPAVPVPIGTPHGNTTPAPGVTVPNPPAPSPLVPATCTYEAWYWS